MKTATKLFAVLAIASGGTAMADAPRTLLNGRPACGNIISNCEGKCPGPTRAEEQAKAACDAELAVFDVNANTMMSRVFDVTPSTVTGVAQTFRSALANLVAPPTIASK